MMSCNHQNVFIRDLSYHTLEITVHTGWVSKNVGSEHPNVSNNSRPEPLWILNLYCGIEQTSIPGKICIVLHQILPHPSELVTRPMGKHMLATLHIAQLTELKDLKVT